MGKILIKNWFNSIRPCRRINLKILKLLSTLEDVKTISAMLVSLGTRRGKSGNIPLSSVQTLLYIVRVKISSDFSWSSFVMVPSLFFIGPMPLLQLSVLLTNL